MLKRDENVLNNAKQMGVEKKKKNEMKKENDGRE